MQAGHDPTRLEYGSEPELNPDALPDVADESVTTDLNSETEIKTSADEANEPIDDDDPQD